MVKVSVIIPIYNAQEYLQKSIESVINQSLKDIEIICVDDGSTDNSLEILNKLSKEHSTLKIFHQENNGSGMARNYGMDVAKGEYIAFLDSDDMYIDNIALEVLYNMATKHDANMVCGNLKRMSEDEELQENFNYKSNNYSYFNEDYAMLPEEYGVPWAFYKNIFKKSFLDENNIKFNNFKRGQDPIFLAEVLTKIDLIIGANINFYAYRVDDENVCSKIDTNIKKFHHILHFKETFDILIDGGLIETFEKFRPQLIYYLENSLKTNDLEIYEIVLDIFGKKSKYFNEDLQKRYDYILTHHMLHKLYFNRNDTFFNEIKTYLIDRDILNNNLLKNKEIMNIIIILNSEKYDDYENKYRDFMKNYLNNQTTTLKNENRILNDTLKILKLFNNTLIKE